MKILVALAFFAATAVQAAERWAYLENDHVKLGINLDAGACMGWFSKAGSKDNLLDAYDVGRYVQQSYYGDADGSDWNGKPWRYNPVQGGSWRNEPAQVVQTRQEPNLLYAKIHPRHWATGKLLEDVTMEQWLHLEGRQARLRFKMTYSGTQEHRPHHQELPALFTPASLDTLVFVDLEGKVQRRQPGYPNEYVRRGAEPWIAWVNTADEGIGLFIPYTQEITTYRVRNGNKADCSYLAPIQTFALKPGLVFEYEVALMAGSLTEIRATFTTPAGEAK